MCGLVAVLGDLDFKQKEVFNQLLVVSSLRGEDSTGVASVSKNGKEVEHVKCIGSPFELMQIPKYAKITSSYDKQLLIGHNRKATVGGISRFTAHPFDEKKIIGVHNGTLTNWRHCWNDLFDKFSDYFTTDSQALIGAIDMFGVEESIKRVQGAYALIWYDREDNTVNFLRNKERELWFAMSDDLKVTYVCSEYRMMALILARNGVKLHVDKDGYSFRIFEEDQHYKFLVGNGDCAVNLVAQEEIKGDEKKPVYNTPFQKQWSNYDDWQDRWKRDEEEAKKLNDPLPLPLLPKAEKKLTAMERLEILRATIKSRVGSSTLDTPMVNLPTPMTAKSIRAQKPLLCLVHDNKSAGLDLSAPSGTFDNEITGYQGKILTEGEYNKLVKNESCSHCQQDVSFEEARDNDGIYAWLSPSTFVCSKCTRNEVDFMKTAMNGK